MEKRHDLKAVVLAAGKGTRLNSDGAGIPKVMRTAAGRPLISYVLDALPVAGKDVIIVVGYMREQVIAAFPDNEFAVQEEQRGTGHAVMSAAPALKGFEGDVIVCCGDMPLVTPATYAAMAEEHRRSGNACTILSGYMDEPGSYGRIVRDDEGNFLSITEARDCTPEQLEINEINSGLYVFDCRKLLHSLGDVSTDNAQGEYYLTDVPAIMLRRGWKVGVCARDLGDELMGVNTMQELEKAESIIKEGR